MQVDTALSQFRQPATRIKINPDTYIQFDGTEHLCIRNVNYNEAIRIKYDILLILYDIVNWKTVGELVDPWPPEDREKIYDALEKMYIGRIISTHESEVPEQNESGLSQTLGNTIHINVENHHAMLKDYVRLAAYRRAIERAVKPDTVGLDLGCGSGILSFFMAQKGAQKIYAVERRPDILLLAEELAKRNHYDQIEFLEGASSQIKESRFSPKATLLVSEILGNGILEENVLEFTIDARDRFLEPGSPLIPSKLDIYVFAFDSIYKQDRWFEVNEFTDLYGVDFSLFGEVLCNKATLRLERYNPMVNTTMSHPKIVQSLDLMTLKDPMFKEEFALEMCQNGNVLGFCAYFKAHLDSETTLTNSPWAPQTHWTNLVYSLPAPQSVQKGETLPLVIQYDGALRIRLAEGI